MPRLAAAAPGPSNSSVALKFWTQRAGGAAGAAGTAGAAATVVDDVVAGATAAGRLSAGMMFDGVVWFVNEEMTVLGVGAGPEVAAAARAGAAAWGCQRAPTPLSVITPSRTSIAKWYVARINAIPRGAVP